MIQKKCIIRAHRNLLLLLFIRKGCEDAAFLHMLFSFSLHSQIIIYLMYSSYPTSYKQTNESSFPISRNQSSSKRKLSCRTISIPCTCHEHGNQQAEPEPCGISTPSEGSYSHAPGISCAQQSPVSISYLDI